MKLDDKSIIGNKLHVENSNNYKAYGDKYNGNLKKVLKNREFSGTAILVDNNKIVDSYVKGNSKENVGNSLSTTYEIDSLQKVLTAGLIMMQVNQNKLSLNDTVNKYLPDVPGANTISIRSLLDMTSGLSMKTLKFKGKSLSSENLHKEVVSHVLYKRENVNKWDYQPVNYILLSEILEKVTGKTYEQLFKRYYIDKFNLKQTEMAYSKKIRTNRSNGYLILKTGKKILQKPNKATIESELGTGQVYMSVSDYYKILSKLLNGEILGKKATTNLFVQPDKKYCAGLYFSPSNYRYSNGYGYGFEDHIRVSKDGKKAVVIFSNLRYVKNNELKKITDELSNNFLE